MLRSVLVVAAMVAAASVGAPADGAQGGAPAMTAIPAGARLIDLSRLTIVPGFVDTHAHEAMTYKECPRTTSETRR